MHYILLFSVLANHGFERTAEEHLQVLVPGDSNAFPRSLGTNVPTPMPMGPATCLQLLICEDYPNVTQICERSYSSL